MRLSQHFSSLYAAITTLIKSVYQPSQYLSSRYVSYHNTYQVSMSAITILLFTIYYSHIYPLLIRGIFVWGQTTKSNQSRLIILQNRSLRIINNSPSRASAKELFIKYNILPFEKLYTQQLLLHMYKVHHNTIPTMYEEFYQKKHTRIIRNTDKYVIPKYLYPLMEKTFLVQAPKTYNKYSEHFDYNVSIGVFKRKVKQILMDEYQSEP